MHNPLVLFYHHEESHRAQTLAKEFDLTLQLLMINQTPSADFSHLTTSMYFEFIDEVLTLLHPDFKQGIQINFESGKYEHRRKFGGGKSQLIAKACAIRSTHSNLTLFDATAGLGRDAFVLATLGADVTLCERQPEIAALLDDALFRYYQDTSTDSQKAKLSLIYGNAIEYLQTHKFDVIYLDPMFPERKKSALVKKEMRILHDLVGDDSDSDQLLNTALAAANKRVVVKRPIHAPTLTMMRPAQVYLGKTCRYDVYPRVHVT